MSTLLQIDNEVSSVASTAKPTIIVDGLGSICEQAWRECGQTISASQQLYSTYLTQAGISAGHMGAVMNTGSPARTQPRVKLNQVVTHDSNYANSQSALQLWVAYTALSMLYREASSRLGKDRYEEKMQRYKQDALKHWYDLRAVGLPIVLLPMEAPGAKHAFAAGPWSTSNLSGASGGSNASTQDVQVAITWYDSSKYVSQTSKGNAESGPSEILAYTIAANKYLKIDITGLTPPAGVADPVGTSAGTVLPLAATHWNVYCGQKGSAYLYLQKESVAVATKTWTLTADPVYSGTVMTQGQFLDYAIAFQNVVPRG